MAGAAGTTTAQTGNQSADHPVRVTISDGILEGTQSADGIRSFKGIPFAAPPVGDLRWKAPQPEKPWTGVRSAKTFGPRAMQPYIYHDMIFRSKMSEDCLYLNVWAPANANGKKLPVFVYFFGGGFIAGDGSEPRYDGESMARKNIVTLTVNYRLGVFGFLALPDLVRESPNHAAGNYGFLDQHAALEWVQKNIAAFGGDPSKVTLGGESAGSMSVCAQVASPLSKGLFRAATGESGAVVGNLSPAPLARSEQTGIRFMKMTGAKSLAELRNISADSLLALASRKESPRFGSTVDGYFFPKPPEEIFAAGEQMNIPLLAGTNSAEVDYHGVLGSGVQPTPENYRAAVQRLYGDRTDEVLKQFPGKTSEEVKHSATLLASDRFIAYSTWKWMQLSLTTGDKPVYRYIFSQLLPPMKGAPAPTTKAMGTPHAAEIPYALGNLDLIHNYAWTAADKATSRAMQTYLANFIKTENPNGAGLPNWPALQKNDQQVMILNANPRAEKETDRGQFLLVGKLFSK